MTVSTHCAFLYHIADSVFFLVMGKIIRILITLHTGMDYACIKMEDMKIRFVKKLPPNIRNYFIVLFYSNFAHG